VRRNCVERLGWNEKSKKNQIIVYVEFQIYFLANNYEMSVRNSLEPSNNKHSLTDIRYLWVPQNTMLKQPTASVTLAYPRKQTLCGETWTTNRRKQCRRRERKQRSSLSAAHESGESDSESEVSWVTAITQGAAAAPCVFTGSPSVCYEVCKATGGQWHDCAESRNVNKTRILGHCL
jgi:hypothetical protein